MTIPSNPPLVSALINNYNYGRYLPECIESVLGQTYPSIEIIVVDDGSTDESREVIERYAAKHSSVKPIYKKNGGQASAYNAGVAAASGEILCFLDSDDVWFPEKVEKIVQAHRQAAFVQHEVLKDGRCNFRIPSARFDRTRLLREFGYLFLFSPSSALSIDRSLASRIFPIPEASLRLCADIFVMLTATYFEGVHTVFEPLAMYRMHEDNNWQRRKKRKNDGALKYQEVHELVNRWLFDHGHFPIPGFNTLMKVRFKKHVLRIEGGKNYYIYGTGSVGEEIAEYVEDEGGEILAFVDSFVEGDGTFFRERPVIGPEKLAEVLNEEDRVVIASTYIAEILDCLAKHGITHERVDYLPSLFRKTE